MNIDKKDITIINNSISYVVIKNIKINGLNAICKLMFNENNLFQILIILDEKESYKDLVDLEQLAYPTALLGGLRVGTKQKKNEFFKDINLFLL